MKRPILISIILGLLLAGATIYLPIKNDPAKTPKGALATFHESIMEGDLDKTKELMTEDIRIAFESGTTPWFVGTFGAFIKDYKERIKIIDPLSEEIKGKTATVKAEVFYKDDSSEIKEYLMIKENGKWKIAE